MKKLMVFATLVALAIPVAAQEEKEKQQEVVGVRSVAGVVNDEAAHRVAFAAKEQLLTKGIGSTTSKEDATLILDISVGRTHTEGRGSEHRVETQRMYWSNPGYYVRNGTVRTILGVGTSLAYGAYQSRKQETAEDQIFRVYLQFSRPDGRITQIFHRDVRLQTLRDKSGDRYILVVGSSSRTIDRMDNVAEQAAIMAIEELLGN